MLTDDPCTVYAITKDSAKVLESRNLPLIPESESPIMIVQVMRYDLDYHDTAAIDPLTAILSLSDEEKTDPRVEAAIEEILEGCLHD
jgi:hypothetical protein